MSEKKSSTNYILLIHEENHQNNKEQDSACKEKGIRKEVKNWYETSKRFKKELSKLQKKYTIIHIK